MKMGYKLFYFYYFEVIFHWRSSLLRAFWILDWPLKLQFKIWRRSDQWLLRYSTFNILRSSSIGGCLCCEGFLFWFGPLSLSLKFGENPISGCWDIQLLIFWDRLPLEWSSFKDFWFWFGPMSLSLIFEENWSVVAEIFNF